MSYGQYEPGEYSTNVQSNVVSLTDFLNLFAGAERGNYAKFDREIAPQLLPVAQQTGRPAVAYWFGEIVGVTPEGARFVLAPAASADEAAVKLQEYADYHGTIYALWYGAIRAFQPTGPQLPSDVPYQPPVAGGTTIPGTTFPAPSQAGVLSGDTLTWLLIGGTVVGLFLMFSDKRK